MMGGVVGRSGDVVFGEGEREGRILPVEAAPLPPAPRQPMRSQDKGVRERRKPIRALEIETAQHVSYILALSTDMMTAA